MNKSQKFKNGSRVEIKRGKNQGCVGIVREIEKVSFGSVLGIEFKNWFGGHSCSGLLTNRESGWRYYAWDVELTNKPITDFKNL